MPSYDGDLFQSSYDQYPNVLKKAPERGTDASDPAPSSGVPRDVGRRLKKTVTDPRTGGFRPNEEVTTAVCDGPPLPDRG